MERTQWGTQRVIKRGVQGEVTPAGRMGEERQTREEGEKQGKGDRERGAQGEPRPFACSPGTRRGKPGLSRGRTEAAADDGRARSRQGQGRRRRGAEGDSGKPDEEGKMG